MTITETLKKIIDDLDEAQGVALVAMDGIVVEEQKRDPNIDIQSLGAEWCTIVRQTDKTMASCGFENSTELSILSRSGVVLMRKIGSEYFLLLLIEKDGNFGKGRYLLRREEMNLKGEL